MKMNDITSLSGQRNIQSLSLPNTLSRSSTKRLITHRDLIRISTFVFGDVDKLSEVCGISDPQLQSIKSDQPRADTCALKVLEIWVQENPSKSKADLQKLLLSAKQKHAAKRFIYCTNIP